MCFSLLLQNTCEVFCTISLLNNLLCLLNLDTESKHTILIRIGSCPLTGAIVAFVGFG